MVIHFPDVTRSAVRQTNGPDVAYEPVPEISRDIGLLLAIPLSKSQASSLEKVIAGLSWSILADITSQIQNCQSSRQPEV
jgi:hypothetical protein